MKLMGEVDGQVLEVDGGRYTSTSPYLSQYISIYTPPPEVGGSSVAARGVAVLAPSSASE